LALIQIKINQIMGSRGPKPGLPQRGGWNKLPIEERLVQIIVSVKGKHYKKAKIALEEKAKEFKV